ncbi:hypothetical protein PV08_04067 [Exophiala spinifera]|uniref:Fungal N-terminal domain-containing protein n=1 Tax=Exophiala spinifera TaxID=91928 RepID=A0A0D1ZW08_9EURO|nr:uncharacterized protein PV08_04067 [Exophiala spinifera]KIW16877.1 hypothetical protein PV08_04067 [Exophiala spinifera]
MDPISAFGVAAGTLQVVDFAAKALLGTIGILKEASNTPKRMTLLLQDVEKSVEHIRLLRELFGGLESLSGKLNGSHLDHVNDNITDICEAIGDLKNTLEPVVRNCNASSPHKHQQILAAMKSVTARSQVEQKASRLILLGQILSASLQGVILESQEILTKQIGQTSLMSQFQHDELTAQINSLKLMSQSIQGNIQDHQLVVDRLQQKVASSETQIDRIHDHVAGLSQSLDSIDSRSQRIEANLEVSQADLRLNQMRFQHTLQSAIKEYDATRKEIFQLRDDFMQWIAGNHGSLSSPPESFNRLDDTMKSNVRLSLISKLAEAPSALKSACEHVSYGIRTVRKSTRADSQSTQGCVCVPTPDRRITRKGCVSFEYESISEHLPKCRIYQNRKRFRNYTVAVQPLPLIRSTLALIIKNKSGAGGCSMGISLSYHRTVKRSESELFKLFDSFPRKLSKKAYSHSSLSEEMSFLQDYEGGEPPSTITFSCMPMEIEKETSEWVQSFNKLLERGCVWDKDEHGNTCLHVSRPEEFLAAAKR